MGNIPVLSWFTQHDQNVFQDLNKNGVYDPGEPGISNVLMTVRFRNGAPSNPTLTDSNGNGILVELFPLFNWYVARPIPPASSRPASTSVVDGGGKVDTTGVGQSCGARPTRPASPAPGTEATRGPVLRHPGLHQPAQPDQLGTHAVCRRTRTAASTGTSSTSTRPFDDQRFNVQTIWEPLVPRVTVNLYEKRTLPDGTETLSLVDSTRRPAGTTG